MITAILAAWLPVSFILGLLIGRMIAAANPTQHLTDQRGERVRGVLGRGENLNHIGGNKA